MNEAQLDDTFERMALDENYRTPGVRAEFFTVVARDEAKSLEAGRPIFKDVEMVRLQRVGDRTTVIEKPVREQDKRQFPREYMAFKASSSQEAVNGTPLTEWPGVTRAQVEELAYFRIRTVEDLAEVSDEITARFMGGYKLKTKAKEYLERAKINAPAERLAKELEERDARIAFLESQMQKVLAKREELDEEEDD